MPIALDNTRLVEIIRRTWLAVFGPKALNLGGDVRIDYPGQEDETIVWAGWELMRCVDSIPCDKGWVLYRGVTSGGGWHSPPDYDMVEVGRFQTPLVALYDAIEREALETTDNVINGMLEAWELEECDRSAGEWDGG